MCFVPKRCNDMMNVGRLQGFEVRSQPFFNVFLKNKMHIRDDLCSLTMVYDICTAQGKITAQGKLLQQDTFSVSEQESGFLSKARERRVFLFEQLVIFSEPIDKKKGFPLPGYTFKNSIKVRLYLSAEC